MIPQRAQVTLDELIVRIATAITLINEYAPSERSESVEVMLILLLHRIEVELTTAMPYHRIAEYLDRYDELDNRYWGDLDNPSRR